MRLWWQLKSVRNILYQNTQRGIFVRRVLCTRETAELRHPTMATGDRNLEVKLGLELNQCVHLLNKFADSNLAEDWDNVGLLVDRLSKDEASVQNALLTIDLTESVVAEAIQKNVDLIISYHPPLFHPVKTLNKSSWKIYVVGLCAVNKIALYSPHTCWDAIEGGVADWLLDAFVSNALPKEERRVLQPVKSRFTSKYNVTLGGPDLHIAKAITDYPFLTRCERISCEGSDNYAVCTGVCDFEVLQQLKQMPKIGVGSIECFQNKEDVHVGMGRVMGVSNLIIHQCIKLIKMHTGLKYVRVALASGKNLDSPVEKIAVLPGSGGSFLKYIKKTADLYVTGEMSHHELLDATQSGISVLLLNHTDSERGYLKTVKPKLEELFQHKVVFHVSEFDRDPLETV